MIVRMLVVGILGFLGSVEALAQNGPMTVERLGTLISAIDPASEKAEAGNIWHLTIAERAVNVIVDPANDRMRILVPVAREEAIGPAVLHRMMQANFDSALDARYAIAQGIVWSAYIHPLASLQDDQFASAISQTVMLALTAGTTYTSGALSFGGGDSEGLLEQEVLDALRKNGIDL